MRSSLLLALVGAVSATFLLDIPSEADVPEGYIPIGQAALGDCLSVPFLHCQFNFNAALGINTDLTWRNATSILYGIRRRLQTDDFGDGPISVCNARQQFVGCLGASYPNCINRFTLLNMGSTDFSNVLIYVHTFKHLEYMCNGGLEIVSNNWVCINAADVSPQADDCRNNFNSSVYSNPNNYCEYARTLSSCTQNFYGTACNSPLVGWSACEDERVGFADECRNYRCTL